MWLAESIYETYKEIVREQQGVGEGIYISLEDLRKRLAMEVRDIPDLIKDIRSSLKYRVLLAKAPGAYRGKRYHIEGEKWVFMSMYRRF